MAAVIGLRGMARGDDFQLSTNKAGSGNFDDLVYTTGTRRYFLQLRHTDNPDTTKLVHSFLVRLLHQCFESYCSIIQDLTDEELESSEFIIYTNKQLGPKLLQHNREQRVIDEIFKTCDEGEIFTFTPDENKDIDVYTLVYACMVKESKEFGDISDQEQEVKLKMISEFLKKLIMITGQKGQKELDDVIIEEIRKMDAVTVDPNEYQTELRHFKTPLESWWRNKKEKMTPGNLGKWLQEAKTEAFAAVVGSWLESCKQKIFGTEIKFSDSEVSRFQTELSDKHAVHLRSDALTLCSKLLLDSLDTSKCIFVTSESLQSNKKMLLHAWLGGHWEWLSVFCDLPVLPTDISDTYIKISEIIKSNHSTKRIIILTRNSVQQTSNFDPVEHKFHFEQLSKKSQEIALDKTIDFQGCEVTVRSVLQRHGNVQHVLGPKLVTGLITEGTAVNIGGRLQVSEEYYAPRVLERKLWVHTDFLKIANDIIVVSGTTEEDLVKTLSSCKTVESFTMEDINKIDFTQEMSGSIFVLSDTEVENSFQAICEKLEGKTLHWFEFNNGVLLWKKSRGSTDSLLDYIHADKTRADNLIIEEYMKRCGSSEVKEESIWNLKERTVLVVADPGMGKSSTTTQVAWNTKLADPTSWVLRINWNEHSQKLEKLKTEGFNVDKLVDFFSCVVFAESKYCKVSEILLKQALKNSGNVTVLTDGYDEISPTYAEKAAIILSTLMEIKVGRVWVTSRPVVREKLEKELSVIAFTMKPLSHPCQEEMLLNCWMSKSSAKKDDLVAYVKRLLSHANESVHDSNFTGFPLYIIMIATAFEQNVECGDFSVPEKVDLLYLFDRFVQRKLQIYQIEKKRDDITNSSVQDDHELLIEMFLCNFQRCALVVTLPSTMLNLLHDKKIEINMKPFVRRVQAGKDKTGVVIAVVEDRPHFVHRTFAEYFTAHWFSENFESNRSVLEQILFDRSYRVVKDVFDRILARDCPLHCAVLNWDSKSVESLLQEKYDVNSVDKGGRTAMHIIAAQGQGELFENITQSLLKRGNYFNEEDNVLKWTPLQYAIKSGSWFVAERLLERRVDIRPPDEEHIRQRLNDPHYIGPILFMAASEDYFLLLKFLYSVGVNMD